MRQLFQLITLSLACILSATVTKSPVQTPGRPESAKTQLLEAGAAAQQSKPPIEAINAYLDGFHFYNGYRYPFTSREGCIPAQTVRGYRSGLAD